MRTYKQTFYAIAHLLNKEHLVSVGTSVLAAWHAAEDEIGYASRVLKKEGYIVLELDCWYFKKVLSKRR